MRLQFFFRIILWVIFILAYSVAIQTPDRGFSIEDVVLYIQLLGYILEDLTTVSCRPPCVGWYIDASLFTDLQDWSLPRSWILDGHQLPHLHSAFCRLRVSRSCRPRLMDTDSTSSGIESRIWSLPTSIVLMSFACSPSVRMIPRRIVPSLIRLSCRIPRLCKSLDLDEAPHDL